MAQMLLYNSDFFTPSTGRPPYKHYTAAVNETFIAFARWYLYFYLIALLIMFQFSLVNLFLSCIYAVVCILPVVLFAYIFKNHEAHLKLHAR